MKKIISILFIVIAYFLFATSCNKSDKYAKEIKQLDSVLAIIDTANKQIKKIDTSLVNKNLSNIKNSLKELEQNIKDTLQYEDAAVISEYRSCKKPLQIITDSYNSYVKDLITAQKQITDLKHDLSINKIQDNLVAKYLEEEMNRSSQIVENCNIIIGLNHDYTEKYNLFAGKIEDLKARLIK